MKFKYLSHRTEIEDLLERVGEDNIELWLDGIPSGKKVLISATIDESTEKIIEILLDSTERTRVRSSLINSLLMLGLKEFFKLRNPHA